MPSPSPGISNNALAGVTVLSSRNAWAVGSYYDLSMHQTLALIEHWNGTAWQQVASPNPSSNNNFLTGVAAVSARNIWAVGWYTDAAGSPQTFILHWNGILWTQLPTPDPAGPTGYNALAGVAAVSATRAWAVGTYDTATRTKTLLLRWNGTSWKRARTPSPSSISNLLSGVTAVSGRNAWAVGYTVRSNDRPFILHWNGTRWRRMTSPNPDGAAHGDLLTGVAAVTARKVWAVGYDNISGGKSLILRWNGTRWRRVASPNPSSTGDILSGVAAVSARNIWAVGYLWNGAADQTLIEHWNGTRWRHVQSPDPADTVNSNLLSGVAASAATNLWAVGSYEIPPASNTLAVHRC